MKSINIKRSVYTKEDRELLDSSIYRKVYGEVIPEKNKVIVRTGIRTVGVVEYSINEKKCVIGYCEIIESEWNPLLVAVDALSTYFKKKKGVEKISWQTR